MLLHIPSFGGSALIRPAVFPHGGFPAVRYNVAVLKIENHLIRSRNLNAVDLLRKDDLIKRIQSQNRSTGFFEHLLRDIFILAMGVSGFSSSSTDPDSIIGIWVFAPLTVRPLIALSAPTALDFAGKAGGIDAPVCQSPKLPAARFLGLHRLVDLHRDDGFVGVLHEILRQLPTVNFAFLADGVLHIFLLEQKVARISDVAEDLSDRGIAEVLALTLMTSPTPWHGTRK